MKRQDTTIPGCFLLTPPVSVDARGMFVKVRMDSGGGGLGFPLPFQEQFYTISGDRVLRGMHFQVPPYDHDKLVLCMEGQVLDVVIDLRTNSPTHGRHQQFMLDGAAPVLLYIPRGLAHGFYVKKGPAIMYYWVTCGHKPDADSGILWSSMNIDWPDADPLVSDRDRRLLPWANFESPFLYHEAERAI